MTCSHRHQRLPRSGDPGPFVPKLAALREAEEITPEQVRGHDLVRQLVSDLLTMQDPPASELRDLAGRLTATASA